MTNGIDLKLDLVQGSLEESPSVLFLDCLTKVRVGGLYYTVIGKLELFIQQLPLLVVASLLFLYRTCRST